MPESVIDATIRITDARRNGAQKVLQAIAEVEMPQTVLAALLERLKAVGVI
jgi:hypothetical protein